MEELKKLKEIILADSRNSCFALINRQTGEHRQYSLEDLYGEIVAIAINEVVPEEVRSQFNVARNLSLYTWFCYSFHSVSMLKAYTTVEMALRIRLGKLESKSSLWKLMREAVNTGLIKDTGFGHIMEQPEDHQSKPFVDGLPDAMAYLRNLDAHGSSALAPFSVPTLRICANIINQLFCEVKNPSR